MKSYHLILTIITFVVFFGINALSEEVEPVLGYIDVSEESFVVADLIPYEISLVWSNTTENQLVDFVIGNFDSDIRDEVAAVSQNGTLFLFDEDGSIKWSLDIKSTPRDFFR